MLSKNSKNKVDQVQMISIDQMVPEDHILRKIDKYIKFDFIYELVEDLYCLDNGRPSIDPVVLLKITLIQYLFNIKSMRQTIKDIEVNLAYRWFLGFDFYDRIPHFTTFSQNYRRRFKDTNIFEDIFQNILLQAIEEGLVDTNIQFVDSTHVKAHANRYKVVKVKVKKEVRYYQKKLEKEINEDRKKHDKKPFDPKDKDEELKEVTKSTTDPEAGLFHKGEHKEVFAYSVQTSCDKNGWILGFKSYPGNLHDGTTFKDFFDEKLKQLNPKKLVMDAGYKFPAIAKELFDGGVFPAFPYTRQKTKPKLENPFYKRDFVYDEYYNCYLCPANEVLEYSTTNREGYRQYKSNPKICVNCGYLGRCTSSKKHQKIITRHIWQDYLDISEEYRYTYKGKAEYKKRKETIERQFGSAKEYHGFRYTNMVGIKKMDMKAALTFATLNMKKLAIILSKRDKKPPKNNGVLRKILNFANRFVKIEQTLIFNQGLSSV